MSPRPSISKPVAQAWTALIFGLLMGFASAAVAQASPAQSSAKLDAAFQAMLKEPRSVDLAMRYAETATELGDYEAAIPPLERLLMFNPDLPQVKLEVGVLYFLLNSHIMATKYMKEVKADAHATPEMVRRAEGYLAKM